MIKRMETELMSGKMGPSMLATSKMIIAMDMAKCIGKTEESTKANGSMEFKRIH